MLEDLGNLVESATLDGDSILRALELDLQIAEGLGGSQLRIALDDEKQSRQSRSKTALSRLELAQLLGVRSAR